MKMKCDKAAKMWWTRPLTWLYCIILCAALLTSFCLGWYTGSAKVEDNHIQASVFKVEAEIQDASGSKVSLNAEGEGWKATLAADGTYTVSLSCTSKTNGHGCCAVTINGKVYQTAVFGKCGVTGCTVCGGQQSLQFTITVPAGEAVEIKIMPQWGNKTLADGVTGISHNAAISLAD